MLSAGDRARDKIRSLPQGVPSARERDTLTGKGNTTSLIEGESPRGQGEPREAPKRQGRLPGQEVAPKLRPKEGAEDPLNNKNVHKSFVYVNNRTGVFMIAKKLKYLINHQESTEAVVHRVSEIISSS